MLSNTFFPFEVHDENLAVIMGVHFTPREIDILSCLTNRRGTSKISSLLSISPNTVFTHTHNIMLKLECSSREGIIDFIEHSRVFPLLKQHYTNLVIHSVFEKHLRDIPKTKRKSKQLYLVFYRNTQAYGIALIAHLKNHLKQAGIDVTIESNNEPDETKKINNKYKIIICSSEKEKQEEIPEEFGDCDVVNIAVQRNYYFFVFEIITKFLQDTNCTKQLQNFIKQYDEGEVSTPLLRNNMLEYSERGELYHTMQFLKNKKWIFAFAVFCLLPTFYFFHILKKMPVFQSQDNLQAVPIRSDLPLPIPSVLLDRHDELTHIGEKLKGENGIQAIALVGPGGIGKTILSRQYAHQQKANVIWEINAETHESLKSSFEDLATALAITEKDQKILIGFQDIKNTTEREKKLIKFVKEHLKSRVSWLLLFDNVEKFQNIQNYFPQDAKTWGKGKIIITTRNSNIQNNKYVNALIQMKELTHLQKLNLFLKITADKNPNHYTRTQLDQTKKFLEKIPSFPLDVSIAAYYLKTTTIAYESYLKSLDKNKKSFTHVQEEILKEAGDYNKTRYGLITLSLQALMKSHKEFGHLLLFISLLDSQHIPRSLLEKYQNDIHVVDNFIFLLKKYSLIANGASTPLSGGESFSMHRSTQEIILNYLIKHLDLEKNHDFLQMIAKSFENYIVEHIAKEDFLKLRLLVSHCEAFLSHENLLANKIRSSIIGELGGIYLSLGDYSEAKRLLEQKKQGDDKSLNEARALTYLGNVYGDLGHYEQAKHVLRQSLAIYQKYFPQHQTGIARTLTSLGNVYRDLGNYDKAKDLLEESVHIYERYPFENPIGCSWTSACLGIVYTILGKYEKAKDLLEQSLFIYQKDPIRNGMGIAWVLAHLGDLHGQLGEHESAKVFFERSIVLYKEHFPEGHIKTGWALSTLGESYRILKEYEKAKAVLEQSLRIYKKHLTENHVVIAGILVYLGAVYKDLGEYEKAKLLLEQSLNIYKQNFSKDHNEIAWALAHLGDIHRTMGQYEKAKTLLEKSLHMYKKFFSHNHVEVLWARTCLKKVCQAFEESEGSSGERKSE